MTSFSSSRLLFFFFLLLLLPYWLSLSLFFPIFLAAYSPPAAALVLACHTFLRLTLELGTKADVGRTTAEGLSGVSPPSEQSRSTTGPYEFPGCDDFSADRRASPFHRRPPELLVDGGFLSSPCRRSRGAPSRRGRLMVPASVWVEDEKQSPPVKDANLSRALVTLFFFLLFFPATH